MVEFDKRPSAGALGNSEKTSSVRRYQNFREQHPVITTVTETAVLYAANKAVQWAARRHNIELGHGRKNMKARAQFIEKHPVAAAALVMGVAPVLEEFVFRKVPSDLLDERADNAKPRWDVGTGINLGFMAMHTGKDGIPVPQFFLGQYAWRTQRELGYKYAVIAHATYNVISGLEHLNNHKKK